MLYLWRQANEPQFKNGNFKKISKAIFETRGSAPRLYRNTIVFLAADKTRLQDLDEAARKFLAWESILHDKDTLDLSPHQVRQAETQKTAADRTVTARLPETYQWLLVPTQENPQAPVTWQTIRLSGNNALAQRASKKLRNDELLVVSFAASRLRMELDRVPLWRGNHVAIRQLVEDFGRYLYLPRLQTTTVLLNAIIAGLALLTWEQDAFAYAENHDESAARYRALRENIVASIRAASSFAANSRISASLILASSAGPGTIILASLTSSSLVGASGSTRVEDASPLWWRLLVFQRNPRPPRRPLPSG